MKSNTDLPTQLTDLPALLSDQPPTEHTQATTRAPWRRPTLVRIDIRRTMCQTGSIVDSNIFAGQTACLRVP